MAIDYDDLMAREVKDMPYSFGDRETMLYALGVGMGEDPMDEAELDYVFEKNLKTVPTMAALFGQGSSLLQGAGINHTLVVHGEQRVALKKPIPAECDMLVDSRVAGAFDKGEKGAIIVMETTAREKSSGDVISIATSGIFARGDGGFGGPREGAPQPHSIPDRAPDEVCELKTKPDQALIYRLSGDRNPLHADPEFADAAGFPRPILHGLCTYGVACRAVLKTLCDYDHTKIAGFDARFSAPVFPGETVVTEMWVDGKTVSYRCRLKERDAVVINNGRCELR